MTSIMPPISATIADVMKPIKGLKQAVKAAAGAETIPAAADRKIDAFDKSMKYGANFRDAVYSAIRFQDGKTWPWAVGGLGDISPAELEDVNTFIPRPTPGLPTPIMPGPIGPILPFPGGDDARFDVDNTVLYPLADQLDGLRSKLYEELKDAALGKIETYEGDRLNKTMTALETAGRILENAIKERGKLAKDDRPAGEIFNQLKNKVNDRSNDVRGGPFGLWTKFSAREAENFLVEAKRSNMGEDKLQEVMELLYDTAVSPFGDLVLDQAAVNILSEQAEDWGVTGLDWSKAVDAYKEDHPIVALYSASINDALNDPELGTNVRALEAMLRAGESAYEELSFDFIRRGPVTTEGEALPAASALAAGASRADRAQDVDKLRIALFGADGNGGLRARVAELKAAEAAGG